MRRNSYQYVTSEDFTFGWIAMLHDQSASD